MCVTVDPTSDYILEEFDMELCLTFSAKTDSVIMIIITITTTTMTTISATTTMYG